MGSYPSNDLLDRHAFRLDRQDPYLRVLCINIFVRDQDRSLRFYVDQLGFGLVVDESYESGGRWVAVAPPDGNTVLALVTPKRNTGEYKLICRSQHAVLVTDDVMAKFVALPNRMFRGCKRSRTTDRISGGWQLGASERCGAVDVYAASVFAKAEW